MLNGGPVNKKELQGPSMRSHNEAQKPQLIIFELFVPFVALSEPTDYRESFATLDRQNFMKRVGPECDQQSGFTH